MTVSEVRGFMNQVRGEFLVRSDWGKNDGCFVPSGVIKYHPQGIKMEGVLYSSKLIGTVNFFIGDGFKSTWKKYIGPLRYS